MMVQVLTKGADGQASSNSSQNGHLRAAAVATLLARLGRERRFYLDDFMDGDGPYAIAVGLFSDEANGIRTSFERLLEWADESLEATQYIIRELISHNVIQLFRTAEGASYFQLTPIFSTRFSKYLDKQFEHVRTAWAHAHRAGAAE